MPERRKQTPSLPLMGRYENRPSAAMTKQRGAGKIAAGHGTAVKRTMRRGIAIAIVSFVLVATPAAAEMRIPCIWNPFGGCSFSFVSPEYAKKPVQPLDPEAALAAINAYRTANGRRAVVL